jgi:hypothetical protein
MRSINANGHKILTRLGLTKISRINHYCESDEDPYQPNGDLSQFYN